MSLDEKLYRMTNTVKIYAFTVTDLNFFPLIAKAYFKIFFARTWKLGQLANGCEVS